MSLLTDNNNVAMMSRTASSSPSLLSSSLAATAAFDSRPIGLVPFFTYMGRRWCDWVRLCEIFQIMLSSHMDDVTSSRATQKKPPNDNAAPPHDFASMSLYEFAKGRYARVSRFLAKAGENPHRYFYYLRSDRDALLFSSLATEGLLAAGASVEQTTLVDERLVASVLKQMYQECPELVIANLIVRGDVPPPPSFDDLLGGGRAEEG